MKTATFQPYTLIFKTPGGTSRGVMHTKETYLLTIQEGDKKGIGECALFRGLSSDDVPEYEEKLQWLCENIHQDFDFLKEHFRAFPSIWIGYEQALNNLHNGGDIYFPSEFTSGHKAIKINGLIWMGDEAFMQKQIEEKLDLGFDCIKLKIGTHWAAEKQILKNLRNEYPAEKLEIRVDANGAFTFDEAKIVLKELASLNIHSIEQPIKAGNISKMRELCLAPATPIALDEELIGVTKISEKEQLLETIRPQYIILKPSLAGGFSGCDEWISIAERLKINWWITSALESNIGLNAIAQYTFTKNNPLPQGLGTGALFTNNFESSLILTGDLLQKKV